MEERQECSVMVSVGEWFRNQNEALDFYFSFLELIMNYLNTILFS